MSGLAYTTPLAIAILAVLWVLLRSRNSSMNAKEPRGHLADLSAGNVLPTHYRYFPLIRQALSEADDRYLEEAAPRGVARQARQERRAVVRGYLHGLRKDFSNLERLGRMVAALSPVIDRRQETERIVLSLKFQLVYGLAWLYFSTGRVPLGQIQYLTGLLGRLASHMEHAISEINALSAEQLSGGANA
jgi:hypothetical protein